jgi:membrane-associated phospholipid phosphatase
MARFFKANQAFLIPVLVFILTGMLFLGLYTKDEIHLYHNQWHGPYSDILFKYLTYLGDGWVFLVGTILALLKKWQALFAMLLAALLTLLLAGGLKYSFSEVERPVMYFKDKASLHLVEGVTNHLYKSFPSGHTTTAFAALGVLAFMYANKNFKLALAALAIGVGYSRMHLSQHFLVDVVAGAFLGTLIALFSWFMVKQFSNNVWGQKRPLNFL